MNLSTTGNLSYAVGVRFLLILAAAALLCSCSAPTPAEAPKKDPTADPSYGIAIQELAAMGQQADQLMKGGRTPEAATIINNGQPLLEKLLAAPHPTLEAMQAVSDFDHLYGRLLIGNGYVGSARMLFQKNVTRWKTWKPQTDETARRLKQAEDDIAECDRHMQ